MLITLCEVCKNARAICNIPRHVPRKNPAGAVASLTLTENVRSALCLWLSGFPSDNTRRAYRQEIEAFAAYAGWDDVAEAVTYFLALEDGPAHAVADKWRVEKIARGLSPASINRSTAALNSLVASARRHGITTLRLEAKGVKSRPYRDMKGPGLRGVQTILVVATDHKRPEKAARIRRSSGLPMGSAFAGARLPASILAIVTSWARSFTWLARAAASARR